MDGVSERRIGTLLQRGGEELSLIKIDDRFTVRPIAATDPTPWLARIPAQHRGIVPIGSLGTIPLHEFSTSSRELNKAMAAARKLPEIAFVSHVYQIEADPTTYVYLANEITIQFAAEIDEMMQNAITSAVGLERFKSLEGIPNTYIYQVGDRATENPIKIANRLISHPRVLTAEPNIVVTTALTYKPRDPLYSRQWYLHHDGGYQLDPGSHISVQKAWDITRGSRAIVVAVTDDSIDLNHPDFQGAGKIVAPRDLKARDFVPLPEEKDDNHGTACAGVCVAEENGEGIVGVAPKCALMPIRTTGYLDDESIEQLFGWCVDRGAAVISCSWGASAVHFPLSLRQRAAVSRAATQGRDGKGCVVLFAAGNANRPTQGTTEERGWPDNAIAGKTDWLAGFTVHPDVVTVSACTSTNQKSVYSNWGPNISVCGPSNNAPPGMWLQKTGFVRTPPEVRGPFPGLGVFTADRVGAEGYDRGDYTDSFGGTSSATPVVAGVAALVLSVNPSLTAAQVKQILQQTTDKIVDRTPDPQFNFVKGTYDSRGHSEWFGYGKVNAEKAVKLAQQTLKTLEPTQRRLQGENDRAVAIPDGNSDGINSPIRVRHTEAIADIRIAVEIEHEFLGDLEIYLVAPDNSAILLQGRTLGRQKNLKSSYTLSNTPALRGLLGRSASGVWNLRVLDAVPGDTGTLKNWQIAIALAEG